jgi:hypothetical protein
LQKVVDNLFLPDYIVSHAVTQQKKPTDQPKGNKMKLYSVKKSELTTIADQIEAFAKSALTAWIMLGQSEKYEQDMAKVRALRNAADAKSVWMRREILRTAGFSL